MMNDSSYQELTDEELSEKAALLADSILKMLPEQTFLVAQHCVILHWFDQNVVKMLLSNILSRSDVSSSEVTQMYEQIITLPFVENFSKEVTFNALTREGLLKLYAGLQPDLLINAAKTMAPIYEASEEYGSTAAEAFFCYLVSNSKEAAIKQLDKLLDEAVGREDWQYITGLFHLRDEAEQLPFVQSFSLSERQWMLKGLANRVQGEWDAAIVAYRHALESNPDNILNHMMLGAIYVDLERYQEALQEYDRIIKLDATCVQAYMNQGIVYMRCSQSENALHYFEEVLARDADNMEAKRYCQQLLEKLPNNARDRVERISYDTQQAQTKLTISISDYSRSIYWFTVRIRTLVSIVFGILLGLSFAFILTSLVGSLVITFFAWILVQVGPLIKANFGLSLIILGTLIGLITDLIKLIRRQREKAAHEAENNLWLVLPRYVNANEVDIDVDRLESFKHSYSRNIRKSIIELARRNAKRNSLALSRK